MKSLIHGRHKSGCMALACEQPVAALRRLESLARWRLMALARSYVQHAYVHTYFCLESDQKKFFLSYPVMFKLYSSCVAYSINNTRYMQEKHQYLTCYLKYVTQ